MKIFVINLKHQTERRRFMETQLVNLGLEYEFIDAVHGSALRQEESRGYDGEATVRENGEKMVPGEIGCALSHISVYERMMREDIPYCLVLEDDVILPNTFPAMIEQARASNFEYVTFNYQPVGFLRDFLFLPHRKLTALTRAIALLPFKIVLKCYEWVVARTNSTGTIVSLPRPLYLMGAYFLRKGAAEKLLSIAFPIRYTSDRLLNVARREAALRVGAYVPLVVWQAGDMPTAMEYGDRFQNPEKYK